MNKKIKKSNLKFILIILFLIIPFFELPLLNKYFPIFNQILKYWKILSFILITIIYLMQRKKSKIIAYIIIYIIILAISTLINTGDYLYLASLSVGILSMSLIFDYGLNSKYKNLFLRIITNYLFMLLSINLFLIILYPNGMYTATDTNYIQNWLLGYKNSLILYIYPCLLSSIIYSYINKNKLNFLSKVVFIVSFISALLAGTSTTLFGLMFIGFYLVFNKMFINNKIFSIKNYVILYIIMYFSIIVLRVQNWFKYIIVNILRRDLTFTGRVYIWDYVINFIKTKPFIGYGVENISYRFMKTKVWQSFHAHNFILEILYKTGMIGLILLIIIIYKTLRNLSQSKNILIKSFLSWFIFIFFIQLLTEAYSFVYIFYIFVIIYDTVTISDESDFSN